MFSMILLGCGGDYTQSGATIEKIREVREERRLGADNLHVEDSLWLSIADAPLWTLTKRQRLRAFVVKSSVAGVQYDTIDKSLGARTYMEGWIYSDAITPIVRASHTWLYASRIGSMALDQADKSYWASIALGFFEQASDDAMELQDWALLDTVQVLERQFRVDLAEALPDSAALISARGPVASSPFDPVAAGVLIALGVGAGSGWLMRKKLAGHQSDREHFTVRERARGKPRVIESEDGLMTRVYEYVRSYASQNARQTED